MIRRSLALLIVVPLLLACSDDDGDDGAADAVIDPLADVPRCDEWLDEGPTAEEVEGGCVHEENTLAETVVYACDDGRTLYYNTAVWGFVDEPAIEYESTDINKVAPARGITSCDA